VIRIWEHEIEDNLEACIQRIEAAVRAGQQQHAADGASRRS
jgi:very-short-patch-repair endonuclease